MIKRALLVHQDAYSVVENMTEWLNDACSDHDIKFRLDIERFSQDAESTLKEQHYDLIICHLNVQSCEDTSLYDQQRQKNGLRLLQDLRGAGDNTPMLLISPAADRRSYLKVKELDSADLITDGINLERDFKQSCRSLHKLANLEEKEFIPEKTVSVDITIIQESQGCSYLIQGDGFPFQAEGALMIKSGVLKKLIDLSNKIASESSSENSNWKGSFEELGAKLREVLFDDVNNMEFAKDFNNVLGMVNNKLENCRFRFKVEEGTYPIHFEALSKDNNDFIVVRAPMYRRLIMQSYRYALFHDPAGENHDLNCLVIKADVEGPVKELEIEHLGKLYNLDGEVAYWEDNISKKPGIGKVKIIDQGEDNRSFYETVRHYLESRWDIVHFAGHSAYRRKSVEDEYRQGYLFMPGPDPDTIEVVELVDFAGLLYDANVRLVYLSSCHSSEKGFVFEMVKQNVPAAVGFRWDIKDQPAEEFTQKFYDHLFEDRSLEGAFLKTRRDFYFHDKKDPIWAAAMLIVQI